MRVRRRRLAVLATLLAVLPSAVALPSAAQAATPPATGAAQTSQVRADCGGPLPFGQIAACSIDQGETQTYTVTTAKAADTLLITRANVSGEIVEGVVTNAAGQQVCSVFGSVSDCVAGAAGTYTITMSSRWGPGEYTLAVDSLKTPSSCTQLDNAFFSFASPGISTTIPAGSAGQCYRFNQPLDSVLQLTTPLGGVQGTIVDAAFQPVCQISYGATQCRLRTAGPYRVFIREYSGSEAAYRLRMPRLTTPAGCPLLRTTGFGDPGANSNTATVEGNDFTCHKVRAAAAGATLFRVYNGQHFDWILYDQAAQQICSEYEHARGCTIPAAGDYILLMPNTNWEKVTYQVAAVTLYRNSGCAPTTGTTWTEPTISVTQGSLIGTHCQPFRGQAGDRILAFGAPTRWNDFYHWVVDSAGNPFCPYYDEQAGCVLPTTGTYRVISYLGNQSTEEPQAPYELQVRRLNNPVGCPTVSPGAYGAAPAGAAAGIRCRILDVPAAGDYRVDAHWADNYDASPTVFDADFRELCRTFCQFAAPGRYTMVLSATSDSIIQNDSAYATTFLPAAPSSCASAPGNGDLVSGEFRAAGQLDCLELSAPAGGKVVRVLPTDATGVGRPYVSVVDANGGYVCDANPLYQYSCELTGEAPFFALVDNRNGGTPTGTYQVGIATVSPPPSCAAQANDSTVNSSADRVGFCFTIAADDHTAREDLRYRRTSGTGNATMSVFSADGIRYCYTMTPSADRTLNCTLPEGQITVLLETAAQTATWQVTRQAVPTP
ncbi:hypothetical protein SAMN05421812_12280 [Asanoa hainanensis]|uniref:Uncharacterized protein n=1 Tax=Asanoa hainanensis TaxID=560556 RepID=A0A239PEI6_9ACTN|nr:hypothetical protein SAMN05421812_12280 [Asanoa hainanensis]